MKRIALVVIPFLCIACSSTQSKPIANPPSKSNHQSFTYMYKGESENWIGFLVYTITGNNSIDKITLIYKGKDPQSVGKIKDSITLPNGGSYHGHDLLLSNGKLEFGGGGTGALPSKNGIASVTMEWNGKKETFDMKPVH